MIAKNLAYMQIKIKINYQSEHHQIINKSLLYLNSVYWLHLYWFVRNVTQYKYQFNDTTTITNIEQGPQLANVICLMHQIQVITIILLCRAQQIHLGSKALTLLRIWVLLWGCQHSIAQVYVKSSILQKHCSWHNYLFFANETILDILKAIIGRHDFSVSFSRAKGY